MFSTRPRVLRVTFDYRRYVHALLARHSGSCRDSVTAAEGLLHQLGHRPHTGEQRGARTEQHSRVDFAHAALAHPTVAVLTAPAALQLELGRLSGPGHHETLGIPAVLFGS